MLAVIDFYNNQQTLSSSSPSPPIIRQHEQEKEQEQINNTLSNDDHRETIKQILDETLNNTVIDGFEVYDQDNNRPVSSKVQRHQIPILFIIKNFLRT
ncbi:unnamed protein product [Rotaria sp. Silwood1]|nr:unnamed protein product [Rotaria sp. Silwood1]